MRRPPDEAVIVDPLAFPARAASRVRIVLLFLAVSLIWGSTWLAIRYQLGVVPPTWSLVYRFAIAAGLLFAFAWARGIPLRMSRSDQGLALASGVLQFVLNFNLVYRAEERVTSGLVAVVFALLIVPNALLGRMFLGRPVSRRFVVGSVVALAGVALLFAHELRRDAARLGDTATGIALTVAAVLIVSVANVMQASDRAARVPVAAMVAWSMLWGTLINLVLALAFAGPPVFDPSAPYVIALLHLAVLGSAFTFLAYFWLLRVLGPGPAAYTSVLIPAVAMLISTLFEAYVWSWPAAGGALVALAGLLVAMSAASPARKSG